jgi:acetylornithine/N-succinyldiaminopimelate aminotransferase
LTDTDGKKYIDFVAGIGVNCLGHNHPALTAALTEQIHRQIHISNYYNSDTGLAYTDELLSATGMDGVFFCNSGAEANEAAIKLARKYGWLQNPDKKIIVTLGKSFHGRTVATLSATGQDKFHPDCFAPYPGGFRCIPANSATALESAFDESVCAFMFECVQGEGGVNLVDSHWVQAAAAAARKVGALVIADEVQTGMGRTGSLFASEQLGIVPDVLTAAKGIAGGVPMGACLFRGNADKVFVAGDHQSTFGGNPLACAAARVVLRELAVPGFFQRVLESGDYLRSAIASWKLPLIRDIRGRGLMTGVDITGSAADVQKSCLAAGLCISTAGANTLRFLPPLVITRQEIDRGLEILYNILKSWQ